MGESFDPEVNNLDVLVYQISDGGPALADGGGYQVTEAVLHINYSLSKRGRYLHPVPVNNIVHIVYWRERAAFQRPAFGQSTAGNDIVATILISLFPFFSLFFSLRRDLFS